jgi:hypothetical protein
MASHKVNCSASLKSYCLYIVCFFFLFFAFSFAAFSFDRFAPDLGAYSGAMAENGRMQNFENVLGLARAPRQVGVVAMAAICVELKECSDCTSERCEGSAESVIELYEKRLFACAWVVGLGCSLGGVQRIRVRMVQVKCYQSESTAPESSSTTCVSLL